MSHSHSKYMDCCICGAPVTDMFGHNPEPVESKGRCCAQCNFAIVIPARINQLNKGYGY